METDRPPDTYVKTVPAIAQMAEKGETSHPCASQIFKNNTCMDYICDPVSSVLEAQKLTKEDSK